MRIEIIFLGTGTSQGIPMIGCDCAVCRSEDPRNKRNRTSILVSVDERNILIDATPELRMQCLANDVRRIDSCLITHTHADHIFGLDDLRRFNQMQKSSIDIWVSTLHYKVLEAVFGYARAQEGNVNRDLPQFNFRTFIPGAMINISGCEIQTFPLPHGDGTVMGYRIGPMAYCTDVSEVPSDMIEKLDGLDVLILGALRPQPHPKHLSIDQAVEAAQKIGANRTYFVHMSHQVEHQAQSVQLPADIFLAYDGLRVTVQS